MSDIGFIFPSWIQAGFALTIMLPVTTSVVLGLGIVAYRRHRLDPRRPLAALKWTAIIIFPLWLGGLGFGASMLVGTIRARIDQAQRYFTLDRTVEIEGIALPAGTQVELNESHALKVAELPDDAIVTLHDTKWRGRIEFSGPGQGLGGTHGRVTRGILAAAAVIDGIPCRGGSEAAYFWGGQLMSCTLSQNSNIAATLIKSDGSAQAHTLPCLADDTVELDGLRSGELGGCRLAASIDFGDIACAGGGRILINSGRLGACTFAKPAQFGPLALPAGAAVTYYDGRPSNFRLPAQGGPIGGFGLILPAGTEGAFCYRKELPERLAVSRTAYIMVGNVKLTGLIGFDCGADGRFEDGVLFDDAMLGGKWRQRGERISRDDLLPRIGTRDPD